VPGIVVSASTSAISTPAVARQITIARVRFAGFAHRDDESPQAVARDEQPRNRTGPAASQPSRTGSAAAASPTPRRHDGRAIAQSIATHTSGTHAIGHRMFDALCSASGVHAISANPPTIAARRPSPRVRRNRCIVDAATT